MKKTILFLLLIFLSACAGKQPEMKPQPADTSEDKLPIDDKITVGTLENGMKYYIRNNQKPEQRAELRLVVNAGSILEDEDQLGLAHFVEHMAFNGTEKFAKQEIVDYLELIGTRFGADLNASTSFDETIYKLRVPTDSLEIIEKAFDIFADWAANVTFDSTEIEKERGVVIEEWRSDRGAQARMRDKQLPVIFHNSRYPDRLPIGTLESLENFSHERLIRFYKDWYRPNLMAFIAVGDFDKAYIEAKIKEKFAPLENPDAARERVLYPIPNHEEKLYSVVSDPENPQSVITVLYKRPVREQGTEPGYRKSIAVNLFSSMLNGRLGEIVQKPNPPFILAQTGYSNLVRSKDAYSLAALVAEGNFTGGLEALLVEAERVLQHGFTQTELDREKAAALRGIEKAYLERDKTNSVAYAQEYIRNYLIGESLPGIEKEFELYKKHIPDISLQEINALASEWITDANRVVLVNAPEKEGLALPTETDLAQVFERVSSKTIEPYVDEVTGAGLMTALPDPGRVLLTKENKALGVTEMKLANGVKVFLKPTDFKEDQVLFTAYSPGGTSLIADSIYIPATTAADVVEGGGLGELDQIQLEKLLADKVVRISPYIGSREEGLNGSASPTDLETLFQLIHLTFTSPRKDSSAFLAYKQRLNQYVANIKASPESAFQDTLQVTLADYHYRARPVDEHYFEEMDLETSFDFYQNRFADASDFTFFFVGNFAIADMKPFVERYLASLPSLRRDESGKDIGIRYPKGVIKKVVKRGSEPKAQTRIVFTGEFNWSRQERYNIQSMVSVLRIMLRERIREELGGTYGVRVSASYDREPVRDYAISISFGSDPGRVEELVDAIFNEIHHLREEGPTVENLQKVQETQRREYEIDVKENGTWLSWLQFYYEHGEDPEHILGYPALVDSLTAATVQTMAQKYLNLENFVQVSLLPEPVSSEQ